MNTRIRILPEQLANQIAAGEVVERPASVVKELLENAIDAGADELIVEVESGGKRLIRVTDNGCGMAKDDLFLALERHATSKISSSSDLFALHTLGFRGEALPSIASVSRLRMTSRPAGQELGWQLYVEGGTVRQAEALGTPPGTTIEVRDIFFNTPGRRKFLRSDETEFGHLADVVTRLAMARPDIHLRLQHNGRTFLEAYRHQCLEERVGALLGRSLAAELIPVDAESSAGEMLTGLIGPPSLNRSSSSHLYTYVNGRFVRDRVLQHAINEAYRTLLEKRRYPVAVLFLDLPPEMVDVNVHPTKHEVRFRDQQRIHDFVMGRIRNRLLGDTRGAVAAEPACNTPQTYSPLRKTGFSGDPAVPVHQSVQESMDGYAAAALPIREVIVPCAAGKGEALSLPDAPAPQPANWRLLGQYLNSYLVCQADSDLLLIDQHAAHERIGFEKLRRQAVASGIERQRLLFPQIIEFDHRQAAVVTDRLAEFTRFGFELEPFGGRTFTLTAVPQLLAGADPQQLVGDMAEELAEIGRGTTLEAAFDRILMRLACHSMIRANQPLTLAEMGELLKELMAIDFGSHCPHGRPVMKRLGRSEIERMFHRC